MNKCKRRRGNETILWFILPALVIYTFFLILPIIGTAYFSLVDWNGVAGTDMKFVGLNNYISVIENGDFILALKNMFRMVVISVVFHTPIALLLAVAINTKCKGYRLFKMIYFVPTVFPITAVGLMWYFIFMPTGALNSLLNFLGTDAKLWLVDAGTAMNSIIFVNVWAGIGYYMVILLAGLTTIPEDLYEAAAIDGATGVRKFWSITIPMLKPTISMCIVLDIIGTIKVFDLVFAMTSGGPNGLTNVPTTLLYNEVFKYSHYGAGSAIGIIIMIICIVLTVLTNRITREKRG